MGSFALKSPNNPKADCTLLAIDEDFHKHLKIFFLYFTIKHYDR